MLLVTCHIMQSGLICLKDIYLYIYGSISAEHCLPFFIFIVHRIVQLKAQIPIFTFALLF